jgi:GDPmannose 4,6-dehydratase
MPPAAEIGIVVTWRGSGVDEKGYDAEGNCIVQVDPAVFPARPRSKPCSATPPRHAKSSDGRQKPRFAELVAEMMREDLKAAERDELIKKHGFKAMDRHE